MNHNSRKIRETGGLPSISSKIGEESGQSISLTTTLCKVQTNWGLECPKQIIWKKWTIGKEYVKKLVVKNITTRTLSFTCKLSESKFFLMDFGESRKLSPGVSATLYVRFRPLDYIDCEDSIQIITSDGEMSVRVAAFIPVVSVKYPQQLDLGYCPTKEVSQRSFILENDGGIPFEFEWHTEDPFVIKPSRGYLMPGETEEIIVSFRPTEASVLVSQAVLKLSTGQNWIMRVSGIGKYPYIFTSFSEIDFGEVMKDKSCEKEISIENRSLVPATFHIKSLEEPKRKVFSCFPSSGVILPHKKQVIKIVYSPVSSVRYYSHDIEICTPGGNSIKLTCTGSCKASSLGLSASVEVENVNAVKKKVSIEKSSASQIEHQFQRVKNGTENTHKEVSMATFDDKRTRGEFNLEPQSLSFGTVRITESEVKTITIYNSSECPVPYRIFIAEYRGDCLNIEKMSKKLVCPRAGEGVLSGRSHIDIDLKYSPTERSNDRFVVFCLIQNEGFSAIPYESFKQRNLNTSFDDLFIYPHCVVEGNGSYPMISITDIRGDEKSKADLWNNFSITSLNNELAAQVEFANSDVISFKDTIMGLNRFMFDFGAAVVGSKDTVVHLNVSNVGMLLATVNISFPFDTLVSVERWAQNQVPRSKEEEKELHIILNNLFQISPKTFSLSPGESIRVTVVYKHICTDNHSVPVLLQVENGKSVVLDFTGQTLKTDQLYLHFHTFEHEFNSFDIGYVENAPMQYYTLRNPCTEPIHYSIDMEALEKLKADNYGWSILLLENPIGVVPENGVTTLRFKFQPLEEKMYEVELPIRILNSNDSSDYPESVSDSGDSVTSDTCYYITFRGRGVRLLNNGNQEYQFIDEEISFNKQYLSADDVPAVQVLKDIPGQILTLSAEVLSFGDLPCFSISRQMVVIKNISETDYLRFEWDADLPQDNQRRSSVLCAEPDHGVLPPLSSVIVKLVFSAGSLPQILDTNICVKVSNETRRKEKEKKKKQYIESLAILNTTGNSKNEDKCREKPLRSNLDATRPPLTGHEIYESSARRNQENGEEKDEYGVKELKIEKYQICLTARVLPLDISRKLFANSLWRTSFIPCLSKYLCFPVDNNNHKNIDYQSVHPYLTDAINVVEALLQDVVNDAEVAEEMFKSNSTPAPYFCEISNYGTEREARQTPSNNTDGSVECYSEFPALDFNNDTSFRPPSSYDGSVTPFVEESLSYSMNYSQTDAKQSTETEGVLLRQDFQQMVEWIFDETAFNILSEVYHEEFDLTEGIIE